jgi:purine nucleosidase/pyrimidine-specific ribonucleoside hydrolase
VPHNIIIDTDTGVDDALAIILALKSPELNVCAITTVAGNVEVDKCTTNVFRILDFLKPSSVPIVAQGSKKPLKHSLFTAPEVHGTDGLGNVTTPIKKIKTPDAVDTILSLSRKFGNELTIVAIGPLTNLARCLRKDAKTFKRIKCIVSMGGAIKVPGNTGLAAEFNYYVDPLAAHLVLNSGISVTVVPLDVTEQVRCTHSQFENFSRKTGSELGKWIVQFTDFYMKYHLHTENFYGGYLHDPIALASVIDPTIFTTRKIHLDVEYSGMSTRGMIVADFRKPVNTGKPFVKLAVGINKKQFLKLFHKRIWK